MRRILCVNNSNLSPISSRQLRSASGRLTVSRTTTNYGDRGFAAQGPRLWNSLPAELRAPDISLDTFRQIEDILVHCVLSMKRICVFFKSLGDY